MITIHKHLPRIQKANPTRVFFSLPSIPQDNWPRDLALILRREFLPAVAVLLLASAGGAALGLGGSRLVKVFVLAVLIALAYWRPLSAIIGTLLAGVLVLHIGENTVIPGAYALAPFCLIAALFKYSTDLRIPRSFRTPCMLIGLYIAYINIIHVAYGFSLGATLVKDIITPVAGLSFIFLIRGKPAKLATFTAVGLSGLALSLLALYQYWSIGSYSYRALDQDDWIINPNYLAFIAGVGAVASLMIAVLLLARKKPVYAILSMCSSLICLICVLFLESRGMLVATVLSSALGIALYAPRLRIKYWMLGILAAVCVYWALGKVADLQGGRLVVMSRLDTAVDDGGGSRLYILEAGIAELADRNVLTLLTGSGAGTHYAALGRQYGGSIDAHNAYLELVLNYGIIGLGLFVALFAYAIANSLKSDNELRAITIAGLAYIAICSLTSNPFRLLPTFIVMATIFAPSYIYANKSAQLATTTRPR